MDCCHASDFIRNVRIVMHQEFARLRRTNKSIKSVRPIGIGNNEYGQLGYSNFGKYGSSNMFFVLKLGNDKPSTLGTVFEREFDGTTNSTIFADDEDDGNFMQLTDLGSGDGFEGTV